MKKSIAKRQIASVLVVMSIVLSTGCGTTSSDSPKDEEKPTSTTEETTTEATPTPTPTPTPEPTPEPTPVIDIGDTVSNDTIEITLVSAEITDRVDPPNASGWYTYYEALEGEDLFCVVVDVTNNDTSALAYDGGFMDIDLMYDETYEYTNEECGFTVTLTNDNDFTSLQGNIAPLGSRRFYYFCALPEAASQGEGALVATINIPAGGEYQYIVR